MAILVLVTCDLRRVATFRHLLPNNTVYRGWFVVADTLIMKDRWVWDEPVPGTGSFGDEPAPDVCVCEGPVRSGTNRSPLEVNAT